jgi:hypothetical protein
MTDNILFFPGTMVRWKHIECDKSDGLLEDDLVADHE